MLSKEQEIQIGRSIRDNPLWAIEYLFGCEQWEKQREMADSVLVKKNRKTAVRSCHGSGKTFEAARVGLIYLISNPDSIVITTAPGWTQVKEIIWREIKAAYHKLESVHPNLVIGGRPILETKLEFGDTWFMIGLATRKEGEATEVAERMLGFHSVTGKILVIIDEGSGVKEPIWGAIDGIMTSQDAQLLATGNPYKNTGSFAKLFKSKGVYKIHVRDTDTPNIRAGKIVIPGLMSLDYPKEMEDKYTKTGNLYLIKVKGEFPKSETDTLIPVDHVEDAFDREVEPVGEKKLGVDVARFGHNETVLTIRRGPKVTKKESYQKEDLMQTVARVIRMMEDEGMSKEDSKNVYIDDTGLGGGVVDRLHEKGYMVNGVVAGATAEDEEQYANIRAENAWAVREWIKTADLPRDDDFYQCSNIKYKWKSEKKGQLLLESKKDAVKRGIESPDTFDSLALTFTGSAPEPFPEQEGIVRSGGTGSGKPITSGLMGKEF